MGVVCGSYRIKIKTISYYRMPRNSSHRAVWREAFVLDEAKLKPFSEVCSCHFVNGDSRCGPLLVPALLTPVAIVEDYVLAAVLPTLVPIVGPSITVVAIEGRPDLTTVDGRSKFCRGRFGTNRWVHFSSGTATRIRGCVFDND